MNSSFWSCPNYIQKTYTTFKTREENAAKSCQLDKSARQNWKLWSLVLTKSLWTWASFFLLSGILSILTSTIQGLDDGIWKLLEPLEFRGYNSFYDTTGSHLSLPFTSTLTFSSPCMFWCSSGLHAEPGSLISNSLTKILVSMALSAL